MNFTTLTWGISIQDIHKFYPKAIIGNFAGRSFIQFNNTYVYNFPGDCGALVIRGASYVRRDEMRAILKYASKSGFTKIFATIVERDYPWVQDHVKLYKNYRWKLVHKGKSNRNPDKNEFVFVKIIHKPEHKGY